MQQLSDLNIYQLAQALGVSFIKDQIYQKRLKATLIDCEYVNCSDGNYGVGFVQSLHIQVSDALAYD